MRFADLAGRRLVVYGAGVEGRAAESFLRRHAAPTSVTVVTDADPGRRDAALSTCDVVVKSPGVSPYKNPFLDAVGGRPVTGGTALWFAESGGERTVAVTGSKGKSTTSSMIAHLLAALQGPEGVAFAGNVGKALLELLDDDLAAGGVPSSRWNVAEISSFQAAEVRHSPAVGVLTALFPEHLDWHGSVERYYADKCNLFCHRRSIVTVANAANVDVAGRLSSLPNALPYGTPEGIWPDGPVIRDRRIPLLETGASALVGVHNHVNLCGALTALRAVGVDLAEELRRGVLLDAIATFRPLPHRLEVVGTVGGRLVVDDGLSTAPDAAIAALAAYGDRPVTILVGGHDRGLDYGALAEALAVRTTETVVLGVPESGKRIIGLVRDRLESAGNPAVHAEVYGDFDDAVAHAVRETPVGGAIVLSPGAPSFGRFVDYRDRSRHFRALLGFDVSQVHA